MSKKEVLYFLYFYKKNILKKILILFCTSVLFSCNYKSISIRKTVSVNQTENLDWLIGNWKRINEKSNEETFESWVKINDNEFLGFGLTLKNGDTISQEKMLLSKNSNEWKFSVSLPHKAEKTVFKVTSLTKDSFICENKSNDFPKKIKYWFEKSNLKAIISNPEMAIQFIFEKQ